MSATAAQSPGITSERKKLYALGGLLAVLVIMVYFTYFSGSTPAPPPPPAPADPNRVSNAQLAAGEQPASTERNGQDAQVVAGTGPVAPLDFGGLQPSEVGADAARNP